MSGPEDLDNHAAATGPFYRGTSPTQRGTSPSSPGTAPSNRATTPTNRGTRVAQATPGTNALGDFYGRVDRALEEASAERKEQRAADALADTLVSPLAAVFTARDGHSYRTFPGSRFTVKVLGDDDFAREHRVELKRQWLAEYAVMFGKAFASFERRFLAKQRSGELARDYGTKVPTRLEDLDDQDAQTIWPRTGAGTPGAFWSEARQTVFVKLGQLTEGLIAHEFCHGYASPQWNEVQIELLVRGFGTQSSNLDEGVTSELADQALDLLRPAGNSVRQNRPSGYHGYGHAVRAQARHFLDLIEGSGNPPGDATKSAYAAGQVSLKFNAAHPASSILAFGKKRIDLATLFKT